MGWRTFVPHHQDRGNTRTTGRFTHRPVEMDSVIIAWPVYIIEWSDGVQTEIRARSDGEAWNIAHTFALNTSLVIAGVRLK